MKKVTGLKDQIKMFDGEEIKWGDELLTFKKALLRLFSTYRAENPEESLIVVSLATSLAQSDEEWLFSEDSEAVLKKVLAANPSGFTACIIGPVFEKVKHAIAIKKEV